MIIAKRGNGIWLVDDGGGMAHIQSGAGRGPSLPVEAILKWGYWTPVEGMQAAGWDESAHPRDPGGAGGGQFVAKSASEAVDALVRNLDGTPEDIEGARRNFGKMADAVDTDPEVIAKTQEAVEYNQRSDLFRAVESAFGPDVVIPIKNDAEQANNLMVPGVDAAHSMSGNAVSAVRSSRLGEPVSGRIKPGQLYVTDTGGTPATLRHEYGHTVWANMSDAQRGAFTAALPGSPLIRDELSVYSDLTGDEEFPEAFAVVTDPEFDPADWAPWVSDVRRQVEGMAGIRADASFESQHPRDPGGEGGGEFIAKGTTAPGGRALPKKPKLIPAEALKEELDEMWYGTKDYELLEHWGEWDEWETKRMITALNDELREGQNSGLLSVSYSKEIARSLAKPRGQARTLLGQLDRVDLLNEIEMHGLDPEAYASELWPEKSEPKPKGPNPKDQGVPDIYLNPETGKFKPGFDAKLKSDLVNSALDNHPTKMVTRTDTSPVPIDTQKEVADWWKSRNADEYARQGWSDAEIFKIAGHDPQLPIGLYERVSRGEGRRTTTSRQSTLLHRFPHDDAVRILEERGWGKYLDDAQAKLKVGGRILSRSPEEQKLIADAQKNWGDALTVRGIEYSRPTTYATTVGTFGPTLSKRLVEKGVTVHVGTGYSTDQDQLQYLNDQGNMSSKGWGNNKLDKAGGFYTNGERKAAVGTAGGDGSANVTAHEIGHAIGHTLAIDTHPKLDEWHGLLYPKLDPYYQQGKKHSQQGRKELWAEGVAVVQERKRRAALGMEPDRYHGITKRSGLMDPEAEEYYAWVESILAKLEAGENAG